jgi:hypothetical protein
MGDFKYMLAVVLLIDVFLFLGQQSVNHINPTGAPQYYNNSNSILKSYDSGGYTLNSSIANKLPDAEAGDYASSDQSVFTDTWTAFKNWVLGATGLGIVLQFIAAPYYMLISMHAPQELAWAIGAFWACITFIVTLSFIRGND